jgi:hypothetical protein
MAIALGGRPEESAKMVWSRGCIAYLLANGREGNAQFAPLALRAFAASQQSSILLQQLCSNLMRYRRRRSISEFTHRKI